MEWTIKFGFVCGLCSETAWVGTRGTKLLGVAVHPRCKEIELQRRREGASVTILEPGNYTAAVMSNLDGPTAQVISKKLNSQRGATRFAKGYSKKM